MEKPEYQNIKVWLSTLKNLRLIHAMTGEQMVKIVDQLVKEKLDQLQKEQQKAEKPNKSVKPHKRPGPFSHEPLVSISDSHVSITAPSSL